MGKQTQIDFSEIILYDIENKPVKVWTFAMILSYSRYKYGYWQDKSFNTQDFVNIYIMKPLSILVEFQKKLYMRKQK